MNKAIAKEYFRTAGLTVAEDLVVHRRAGQPGTLGEAATVERSATGPAAGHQAAGRRIERGRGDRPHRRPEGRGNPAPGGQVRLHVAGGVRRRPGVDGGGFLGDQRCRSSRSCPTAARFTTTTRNTPTRPRHGTSSTTTSRRRSSSACSGDALAAHCCLGCRDMSRVDFILTPAGKPYVLEINTIPGFTSHSLLPKAAAKTGVTFDQLVERIAQMAMARSPGSD